MKDKVLSLRITSNEKAVIDELCAEFGVTMTELLVRVSLSSMIGGLVDSGEMDKKRGTDMIRKIDLPGIAKP